MNKSLVSVLLSCLIASIFVSSVSAQLPYFTLNFDRIYYNLGSTGAVAIEIRTTDQAFDIREMGFQLYFPTTGGVYFVTELYRENYGDSPLQIPAYDSVTVYVDFAIPQRSDLVSGIFYYVFNVTIREQGTTTYSQVTTEDEGLLGAKSNDINCVLLTSEATMPPSPTTGPTPTSTPTPTVSPSQTPTPTATLTPTPTPTSTSIIDFSSVEVLFGVGIVIAVVIIIILVLVKKRKK